MEEVAKAGGWDEHARKKAAAALAEFGGALAEMKEQTPSAYSFLIQNLKDFKDSIMNASGISSAINRFESAMTAGSRVGRSKLEFMIGKWIATDPVLSDFQRWINQLTMEVEQMTQENWIGGTIGGTLGAAITTYYFQNPQIGWLIGNIFGGMIEAATKKHPLETGIAWYLKYYFPYTALYDMTRSAPGPSLPINRHTRDYPMEESPIVTQDLEIEIFKKYNLV